MKEAVSSSQHEVRSEKQQKLQKKNNSSNSIPQRSRLCMSDFSLKGWDILAQAEAKRFALRERSDSKGAQRKPGKKDTARLQPEGLR